jgi:hypothetical protein
MAVLARWNQICHSTGKWMNRLIDLENTPGIEIKRVNQKILKM